MPNPAKSASQAARELRPVYLPESMLVLFLVLLLMSLLSLSSAGCTGFRAARLYQEGTVALNAGDAELAVVRLAEAGQLKPDATEIQNHLGLAYAASGQRGKALSAFQRAVDLDCSNDAAVHNLAAAQAAARSSRAVAITELAGEPSDER